VQVAVVEGIRRAQLMEQNPTEVWCMSSRIPNNDGKKHTRTSQSCQIFIQAVSLGCRLLWSTAPGGEDYRNHKFDFVFDQNLALIMKALEV